MKQHMLQIACVKHIEWVLFKRQKGGVISINEESLGSEKKWVTMAEVGEQWTDWRGTIPGPGPNPGCTYIPARFKHTC